jgi:hypothetical protein
MHIILANASHFRLTCRKCCAVAGSALSGLRERTARSLGFFLRNSVPFNTISEKEHKRMKLTNRYEQGKHPVARALSISKEGHPMRPGLRNVNAQALLLLLAISAQTSTVNAQALTFASSTYALGDTDSGPNVVAVADFNGDGTLDIICPNYGFRWADPGAPGGWNNTCAVLTNTGGGAFVVGGTLVTGTGPCWAKAADLNGDSHVDVICANQTDNTLTVLINSGTGGFTGGGTLPVGATPQCVTAADLTNDGKLDLVSANGNGNSLTVWFNDGIGGFVSNATLTVGNGACAVVATDVNGDGWVDLISANRNGNTLTVLSNNGNGTFGTAATLSVGNKPNGLGAADVNGDGKPDLVSVNWGANSMTVWLNNGSGGFESMKTYAVGSYPSTVAVGDFNGDGSPDLICANTGPNPGTLTVYANDGGGGFVYNTTITVGGYIPNVVQGDVNGDGKLDLVCPNFHDGSVSVMLNTSAFPVPTPAPTLRINRQGTGVRVAWPSNSPGWSLQETAGLMTHDWMPSGYCGHDITDDGISKSMATPLPTPASRRFFRLIHP